MLCKSWRCRGGQAHAGYYEMIQFDSRTEVFFRKPNDCHTIYSYDTTRAEAMLKTDIRSAATILTIAVKLWASSYRLAQQQREKRAQSISTPQEPFLDDPTRNVGYFLNDRPRTARLAQLIGGISAKKQQFPSGVTQCGKYYINADMADRSGKKKSSSTAR